MNLPGIPFAVFVCVFLGGMAPAQILKDKDVAPPLLIIETAPNAQVFVDDVLSGTASPHGDYVVRKGIPGPHVLRVTAPGRTPFVQKIVTVAGKTIRIRADLGAPPGDLEILTTADAEILIDGKAAGLSDSTGRILVRGLSAEDHTVRAGRAGYNSTERRARLIAGIVSTVTLELRPIDAADASAVGSPPDYVWHRSLLSEYAGTIRFLSGGVRLLSFGLHAPLVQWDPASGRELKTTDLADNLPADFSPDLKWRATESVRDRRHEDTWTLTLADNDTGRVIREWPGLFVSFTPDSKQLVMKANRESEKAPLDLQFWDIGSDKPAQTWHDAGEVLFTSDGRFGVACGDYGKVTIRDARSGAILHTLPSKSFYCRGAVVSPDGRWLALPDNKKIELWEVATGRQGRTIELPENFAASDQGAIFTSDSRYVITVGPEFLYLWDTFSGSQVRKWPHEGPLRGIAVSPDGQWMAGIAERGITVWRRVE